MLRHIYDRLEVTGELTAVFDPKAADGLDKAVEHLRRLHHPVSETLPPLLRQEGSQEAIHPQTWRGANMTWLRAVTNVKVANYRWAVNALLTYDQVDGKTNEEIWRMFDAYTDKHIETVVRAKASYPTY